MRNLTTVGGNLFFASVQGTSPTLQDTMVAASVYVRVLEEQFPSAQKLLSCFAAWAEDAESGLSASSDDQLHRAKQWIAAHQRADEAARPWLSDPGGQTFLLRVPGGKQARK